MIKPNRLAMEMLGISGEEAAQYSMFLKVWGTRERVNDIVNPRYPAIGDVMLPRNSVIHYQQQHPGDLGPSNQASFISNYDQRINIYFWPEFQVVQGIQKNVLFNMNKDIKRYEAGHFNYKRARNYQSVISKQSELLVNNMAMRQSYVVYNRQTVFTPFQTHYNVLYNAISAVNEFAVHDIHQFLEIKLPTRFPSFIRLQQDFKKYRKFFDEKTGEIVRYDKDPLKMYQGESSFWLLDLYAILIGYDHAQYSQFNRLSEKARGQLELVFTFEGRCWIVNLQTLITLIAYDDKPGATEIPSTKYKYFKHFYLAMINLVTPLLDEIKEETPSDPAQSENTDGTDDEGGDPEETPSPSANSSPTSLADLYKTPDGSGERKDNPPEKSGQGNLPPDGDSDERADGSREEDSPDEKWSRDVDDAVFEKATVETASISTGRVTYGPEASIKRVLEERARRGTLTTKEKEYFTSIASAYKTISFGGRTLEEIITITPEDTKMEVEPLCPDSPVIVDKSVLQSRTVELSKQYREKLLDRQVISAIVYGCQLGNFAVLDLDRETVINAESKFDYYTVKLQPIPEGNQSTRRFRIPRVGEDNTLLAGDVKIYGQLTRMEKPIRKIGKTKVSLTSYYDKKIMIERSPYRNTDFAQWLKTNIIGRSYEDKTIQVQLGGYSPFKKEVCWYYSILAERFKTISTPKYLFDFDTEKLIGENKELRKLCNAENWIVGMEGKHPILIDQSGLITVNGEVRGYIEEILGLNMHKANVPNTTVNINGYKFQSVVVLSYWIGFSELMRRLKPVYRVVEPGTRVNLGPDEYLVQFSDERLVFNRRDQMSTLVFSGLALLPGLSNFSRSQLDDPNVWFSIISDPKVRPTHFREMEQMFAQFIDPMTANELVKMKYPVEMDRLLLRAIELLLNNETMPEVEISEQRIVGYERIAGHIYREFVKSNRQFRNKPGGMKKTFDLNPEAIMMNILTDSSFQSVEEVNFAHQLKQQEEVTFGGSFGRSDMAMVRRTRGQFDNYEGIISEAGKDSGKVGFIGYLVSDAKISDLSGNVDVNAKTTDTGRMSITGNLLYGTTRDDTKRTLFSGVQLSQWMAADGYKPVYLRTSMDAAIAYRTSELYTSVAKQDGTVTEVTDEGIRVKYDDGEEDVFTLGYEIGKGAGEYHKHVKVTDVNVGDKFPKGKVLAWNKCFLARDTVDPNRVTALLGVDSRIALIEDQFTFEDSIGITKLWADKVRTPYIKINDARVDFSEALKVFVKVGDIVEYDQVLLERYDSGSAMFTEHRNSELDGLDRLGVEQTKSALAGRVCKIEVLYNGDPEDASESVRQFIKQQDGVRSQIAKFKRETAETGQVGGAPGVTKTKIYPGTMVVNIYVEADLSTTVADKFVVGNQMKGTVGFIYPEPIYTVDGQIVDITFSVKSLLNRMVLSLRDKLVANEYNFVSTSRLIAKYGRYE